MVRNALIGGLILAVMSMYLLMSSTTPSDAHPVVILLFFLLLYLAFMMVTIFLLVHGSKLTARLFARRKQAAMTYERAYMVALLLALAPVMLVAINSVGGVSFREVALVVLFEAVALFYLWRRR